MKAWIWVVLSEENKRRQVTMTGLGKGLASKREVSKMIVRVGDW